MIATTYIRLFSFNLHLTHWHTLFSILYQATFTPQHPLKDLEVFSPGKPIWRWPFLASCRWVSWRWNPEMQCSQLGQLERSYRLSLHVFLIYHKIFVGVKSYIKALQPDVSPLVQGLCRPFIGELPVMKVGVGMKIRWTHHVHNFCVFTTEHVHTIMFMYMQMHTHHDITRNENPPYLRETQVSEFYWFVQIRYTINVYVFTWQVHLNLYLHLLSTCLQTCFIIPLIPYQWCSRRLRERMVVLGDLCIAGGFSGNDSLSCTCGCQSVHWSYLHVTWIR